MHSGAAHHHGLNPYGYYPWLDPQPISKDALNLNPPISVYAFDVLSQLDPSVVRLLFIVGSCVTYFAVTMALLRAYPEKQDLLVILSVVAMAGLWHMLWYLQLYAPLLLAIVAGWLLIRRGDYVLAGILIGFVIAIKPNYAMLVLLLLAARHYRIAFPAMASAALISAIPLLIDGPTIYRQWLELSSQFGGLTWTSNASLVSAGARLGSPLLGKTLSAVIVVAVLFCVWRIRPKPLDSLAIGLMTVLLLGPVSWAGYTLFLLPFLFARRWDRTTWLAVLMLDAPFSPQGAASSVGKSSVIAVPFAKLLTSISGLLRDLHGVLADAWDVLQGLARPLTSLGSEVVNWLLQLGLAVHSPQAFAAGEDLVRALLASIYAWAILLLLGTFLREKLRETASENASVALQPIDRR